VTVGQCPQGHPTPTSAQRDARGTCLECKREYDRLFRLRNRAALDVVRVFESAGVQFQEDGQPIDAAEVARQLVEKFGDSVK
jgi:hypothetical protein